MTTTVAETHPTTDEPDNSKLLVGMGPVLEQTLNDAGIRTFEELASRSITELQDILPDLHGNRVEREDWIGQARSCADAKARGEDPNANARGEQAT